MQPQPITFVLVHGTFARAAAWVQNNLSSARAFGMRERCPPHLRAAIDAYAEQLPFPDRCFDAAMGTFTVHQWANPHRRPRRGAAGHAWAGGLPHLRSDAPAHLLVHEYSPEVIDIEPARYPPVPTIVAGLESVTTVTSVPIPLNCTLRLQ